MGDVSKTAIKQAGEAYIAKNISIIPVGKDKKPLIEWKNFQTKRATKQDLYLWLACFPEMQLGIVTGKISNLIVVDVDDPKMDLSWLPETVVVKTGSGGFHFYYQYSPGVSNKAGIREKVDIRGDGGYVVAPPSRNLNGEYKVFKNGRTVPFPEGLFLQAPKTHYTQIQTEYEGFSEGRRNDEMTRYIGHLLAKIHPTEWDKIAWKMSLEANRKNTPPLQERELKIIFDSIAGKEKTGNNDRWYKQQEALQTRLIVKNAEDYKDRYTWGTRGLDTTLAIIKRGNFIIVGAKRGSGKTTFTFDLACKNALLGHHVLYVSLEMEEQKIKEDFARKFASITVEEEYDYSVPEYKKMAFDNKIAEINGIDRLYFRGMRRGEAVDWGAIIKIINEFDNLDLIIIDNLDLIEGERNENDLERQKRITRRIMGLTAEKQIPIVLIHHHRKSGKGGGKDYGSDELAGSGKIGDNADVILKITRCGDADSEYPEKYRSVITQQKGRGYQNTSRSVFFVKGSFEDDAPSEEDYYNLPSSNMSLLD